MIGGENTINLLWFLRKKCFVDLLADFDWMFVNRFVIVLRVVIPSETQLLDCIVHMRLIIHTRIYSAGSNIVCFDTLICQLLLNTLDISDKCVLCGDMRSAEVVAPLTRH